MSSLGFQFSQLAGVCYKGGGSVVFAGDCLISPVGNRVSIFNLVENKTRTLPFEASKDISTVCVSPDQTFLITCSIDGRALCINLRRTALIGRLSFKAKVSDIKFSPCGRYFAVTVGRQLQVWKTPGYDREFAPFSLYRKYSKHYDDISSLDWSWDSRFIVTGSRDTTCRVYSLDPIPGYRPVTLSAHRDRIIGAYFEHESLNLITVSRDGTALRWINHTQQLKLSELLAKPLSKKARTDEGRMDTGEPVSSNEEEEESEEETLPEGRAEPMKEGGASSSSSSEGEDDGQGAASSSSSEESEDEREKEDANAMGTKYRWTLSKSDKHYFMQDHAKVVCAVYHKASQVLVAGFTNGVFALYEMPDFNNIHSLSISQKRISTVAVNASGEWLAFGCGKLGQLLVWEWQSETYIMKQQGHYYDMNVLAFSPDGQVIATGADDGKVKLWNTSSGFCYVTFSEHTGAITGLQFAQSGLSIVSSSLDGTVRAFDLTRYRNFRTFTSPQPVQFSCLALDSSGEIVCAGCQDSFEIYVWSMQTGRLLDIMAGHEGPVSSLAFHPVNALLASGSWDRTIKVWDVFENKGSKETLQHKTDVVNVVFRPDGKELAVSCLDGSITLWAVPDMREAGTIDGRRDIQGGRLAGDKITAKHSSGGKCFTSLCYTADGTCILAGGQTKYVCIYEVAQKVLLKSFVMSDNKSIDGILFKLNSKNMTEGGALEQDAFPDSSSDVEERLDESMPGSKKGDFSSRKVRPEIRTKHVLFSPTGRAWAAATTEGLVLYSLDDTFAFDPFDLDLDITRSNVLKVLASKEYVKALVMSFRLNEADIVHQVIESVPVEDIQIIAQSTPKVYLEKLLAFLGSRIDTTAHIEFYLLWCNHVFNAHGRYLKDNSQSFMSVMRTLQKNITKQHTVIGKLCDENKYLLRYLSSLAETYTEEDALGAIEGQ